MFGGRVPSPFNLNAAKMMGRRVARLSISEIRQTDGAAYFLRAAQSAERPLAGALPAM